MARHMISKNGNGWGIFEIQDYNGSLEFKLFGEDYQKFKHLLEEGKALFIKGGFQRGWRDDSQMEFKPREIKLLEGVGESMTESITVNIPVEKLTHELIEQLDALCQAYKGDHRLRMKLYDSANRLKLDMFAKDRRVLANNDFVNQLANMGLEYRLN
jgi:DNA polymerase-3 subunit alpha